MDAPFLHRVIHSIYFNNFGRKNTQYAYSCYDAWIGKHMTITKEADSMRRALGIAYWFFKANCKYATSVVLVHDGKEKTIAAGNKSYTFKDEDYAAKYEINASAGTIIKICLSIYKVYNDKSTIDNPWVNPEWEVESKRVPIMFTLLNIKNWRTLAGGSKVMQFQNTLGCGGITYCAGIKPSNYCLLNDVKVIPKYAALSTIIKIEGKKAVHIEASIAALIASCVKISRTESNNKATGLQIATYELTETIVSSFYSMPDFGKRALQVISMSPFEVITFVNNYVETGIFTERHGKGFYKN
jgi:hypothetical protein